MEALASGLPVVSFDCAAAAEHVDDGMQRPPGRCPATKPASSPPPPPSRPRRPALQSFREAAVAAARRATWDEVLERFEARLQDTVDAFQASPAAVPVVA